MESTRPIRALVRGLEALTVLNLRDGATVSEIAHEIRLPRTTVYRILETLCESGFVYRDAADERYRLTVMVRSLSCGFADEAWIVQAAAPLLLRLAEEVIWPVHLSTLDGMRLMVRDATDSRSPFALERCGAGIHLPLAGSAAGRAYLAFCSVPQRESLLEALSKSARREDAMVRSRPDLLRALEEIRAQGCAQLTRTRRLVEEVNLSVPVLFNDRPVAILTVRFLSSTLPQKAGVERFLPKLRQCAAKISVAFSAQQAGGRSCAPQTAA